MKKTLFIVLTLLAALLVCVSCDNSLDADVFTPDPTPETDPNKMPLTLEFIEAGELTITISDLSDDYGDMDVYYAINGGKKTLYSAPVSAAAGDKVTLYRTLENAKASYPPHISINCSKDCYIYGNVMSLIDPDNYATKTEVVASAFYGLFKDNTHIKNHESIDLVLPATTLSEECYAHMFYGCTSLTKAPELPATTLAYRCYESMFFDCTSLTKAPELPATTLAEACYACMFYGCTSLTKAPELPATTLAEACYAVMFRGCSSLNSVICLATNIGFTNCTTNWLADVSETGDFYKASGASWATGSDSGIPTGWTSHDAN